jgi:hypothetical protein
MSEWLPSRFPLVLLVEIPNMVNLRLLRVGATAPGRARRHQSPLRIEEEGWAGLYLIRCGCGNRKIEGPSAANYEHFKAAINRVLDVK